MTGKDVADARALLNWSQGRLALMAGATLVAVRSFEQGRRVREVTVRAIRTALEAAGLTFDPAYGVRGRN